MQCFGWAHPRHAAEAGPAPHRSPLARGPAAPSPLRRPIAAFGPLRTVRIFHPGRPGARDFPRFFQKMATWHIRV